MYDDLDAFFREQEERMNLPDEDWDEYLSRLRRMRQRNNVNDMRVPQPHAERVVILGDLEPDSDHASKANESVAMCSRVVLKTQAGPSSQTVQRTYSGKCKSPDSAIERTGKEKRRKLMSEHGNDMPKQSIYRSEEPNVAEEPPQNESRHMTHRENSTCRNSVQDDDTIETFSEEKSVPAPDVALPHELETPSAESHRSMPQGSVSAPCSSGVDSFCHSRDIRNTDGSRRDVRACTSGLADSRTVFPHDRQGETLRPSTSNRMEEIVQSSDHSAAVTTETANYSRKANGVRQSTVLKLPEEDAIRPDISNFTTPATSGTAEPSSAKRTLRCSMAEKQKRGPLKKEKSKKKIKELITPLQYAQRLQAKIAELELKKRSPARSYLRGKKIYYYGGDMQYASEETRKRMDFIIKYGGTLVPVYDPTQITHIVTNSNPHKRLLLRALGLQVLDEIPNHIPTVTWSWVVSGLGRNGKPRTEQNKGKGKVVSTAAIVDAVQDEEEDSEVRMDYEIIHAAFKERLGAGFAPWINKTRQKQQQAQTKPDPPEANGLPHGRQELHGDHDSGELSGISEFTQDKIDRREYVIYDDDMHLPSLSSAPRIDLRSKPNHSDVRSDTTGPSALAGLQSRAQNAFSFRDPLAGFYTQARAELDAEVVLCDDGDDSDDSTELIESAPHDMRREAVKKRGFLCDTKGGGAETQCANQDVIDKLEELMELHKAKLSDGDRWRVHSYSKAIRALQAYPKRIKSHEEARAIRDVGEKTAHKIMEIIQTGNLRRISYEKTEDVAVIKLFQGIYGVGCNVAYRWYASGCRTLDDIRAKKGGIKLSTAQEIGLKYFADINTRMPRSEAQEIFNIIKPIALIIDPKLFIEIMGSFRRGKKDCGDIDIMITRSTDDGKTHQGVLCQLLEKLHEVGIITEDLCLPENFDDLELVYRGLCRKDEASPMRRIDFLTVPYKSRGAALLYYTGDDIFNRSLRLKANIMGYSLNQRGLFAGVVRNPSDRKQKLNEGTIIASETEQEILDILGVPWQEPHERVRG